MLQSLFLAALIGGFRFIATACFLCFKKQRIDASMIKRDSSCVPLSQVLDFFDDPSCLENQDMEGLDSLSPVLLPALLPP